MLASENALYIVPTPIGNMDDITNRAVAVLSTVDVICAEDTRHSLPLLEKIGVKSPTLISFHDHNESAKAKTIVDTILSGKSVAIISDAGTPLISDPGYHLVKECVKNHVKVIPLPGPCAAITALSASGMPTDRFSFEGFLPVKAKALLDKLNSLKYEERTMIFYEAPRRIIDSIKVIAEVFEDRNVTIGRELTKTFETFYYGKASEMVSILESDENYQKGEMVVIVQGYVKKDDEDGSISPEALSLLKILCEELSTKAACKIVASHYNLKKNVLYDLATKF
jgi:16S rRNA (cytidine1402-2'-O)-methyltransferase